MYRPLLVYVMTWLMADSIWRLENLGNTEFSKIIVDENFWTFIKFNFPMYKTQKHYVYKVWSRYIPFFALATRAKNELKSLWFWALMGTRFRRKRHSRYIGLRELITNAVGFKKIKRHIFLKFKTCPSP